MGAKKGMQFVNSPVFSREYKKIKNHFFCNHIISLDSGYSSCIIAVV